jgi:hypothetical protein
MSGESASEFPTRHSVVESLLAQAAESRSIDAAQGYSTTVWSMSRVCDLLWRHSPRSRPIIYHEVVEEFRSALESGRMPGPIMDLTVLSSYWSAVLKPLFDSFPDRCDELQNELQLLNHVLPYRGSDDAAYVTEIFTEEIAENVLHYSYIHKVRELDQTIADRIVRATGRDIARLIRLFLLACGWDCGGSAGESGLMAVEGEHGKTDEDCWGCEAVGHAAHDADIGVDRFDQPVGES